MTKVNAKVNAIENIIENNIENNMDSTMENNIENNIETAKGNAVEKVVENSLNTQNLGKLLNKVSFMFLSKSENVALARAAVAAVIANSKEEYLDMTISQLEEIKVAVSEGVSNAIIHGYLNQEDKEVKVEVAIWELALTIKISDEGVGIEDIDLAMTPNFSSQPNRMGLGFAFMNSFTDKLIVNSEINQGTTITMLKKLPMAEL